MERRTGGRSGWRFPDALMEAAETGNTWLEEQNWVCVIIWVLVKMCVGLLAGIMTVWRRGQKEAHSTGRRESCYWSWWRNMESVGHKRATEQHIKSMLLQQLSQTQKIWNHKPKIFPAASFLFWLINQGTVLTTEWEHKSFSSEYKHS